MCCQCFCSMHVENTVVSNVHESGFLVVPRFIKASVDFWSRGWMHSDMYFTRQHLSHAHTIKNPSNYLQYPWSCTLFHQKLPNNLFEQTHMSILKEKTLHSLSIEHQYRQIWKYVEKITWIIQHTNIFLHEANTYIKVKAF